MLYIFDFCFSKGLTDVEDEWANIIWYKNDVGAVDADVMINIEDAKRCLKENCIYGNRNGGTTIKLPFGTVEWHSPKKTIPGNMQFHHKYEDIMSAIEEYCKENDIIFDKHNPTSDFENKK